MNAMGKLHRRKDLQQLDEGGGYPRHRWILIGMRGAVQFVAVEYRPGTAIYDVMKDFRQTQTANGDIWDGWDVGYHSPRPMYEDHEPMDGCDVLEGNCWYDGSGLMAQEMMGKFIRGGELQDEAIWRYLEAHYLDVFHQDMLFTDF